MLRRPGVCKDPPSYPAPRRSPTSTALSTNLWVLSLLMLRGKDPDAHPTCVQRQDHGEGRTAPVLCGQASTIYIVQNRPQAFVPHPMHQLLAYINHKVESDANLEPIPPGTGPQRAHCGYYRMDGVLNSSAALLSGAQHS